MYHISDVLYKGINTLYNKAVVSENLKVASGLYKVMGAIGQRKTTHMNILIAEDDFMIGSTVQKCLQREGHNVLWELDGKAALRVALTGEFDLIILDNQMPKMSGVDVAIHLEKRDIKTPIIMFTEAPWDVPKGIKIETVLDKDTLRLLDYIKENHSQKNAVIK